MSVLLGTDTCKKCGMKNSRNQDGHCAHCGAKVDTDDRIPLELQAEPLNKALRVFERMQKGFAIPGVRQGIHRVADVGDHPSGGKRVLMRGPGEQAKTNYNNWSGPVSHISPHPDQSGVPSGHGVFNVHFSDKTKPVVAGMLHEHAKKLPGYPSSLAKSLTVFERMFTKSAHDVSSEARDESGKWRNSNGKLKAAHEMTKDEHDSLIGHIVSKLPSDEEHAHKFSLYHENAKLTDAKKRLSTAGNKMWNASHMQAGAIRAGIDKHTKAVANAQSAKDAKLAMIDREKDAHNKALKPLFEKYGPYLKEVPNSSMFGPEIKGVSHMTLEGGLPGDHRDAVYRALRSGKRVSARVLKDHPGLKEKVAADIERKKSGTSLAKSLTVFDRMMKGGPGSGRRPVQPQHSGAHNPTTYKSVRVNPSTHSIEMDHYPAGVPHHQSKFSGPVSRVQEHTPGYVKSHEFHVSKGVYTNVEQKHVRVHYKGGGHNDVVMPAQHVNWINNHPLMKK